MNERDYPTRSREASDSWPEAMSDAPEFQGNQSEKSNEFNYESLKKNLDERFFKRGEMPEGTSTKDYLHLKGDFTGVEGDAFSWNLIESVGAAYSFEELRKDMDARISSGTYISQEKFQTEEDYVYGKIEDEIDVDIQRRIESGEIQDYDDEDTRRVLRRHYDRMIMRVSQFSAEHPDEDGTQPSIRTACNQMIAMKIRAMSHDAEAGRLSEQDKKNFGLELEALGRIRCIAESREDEERRA